LAQEERNRAGASFQILSREAQGKVSFAKEGREQQEKVEKLKEKLPKNRLQNGIAESFHLQVF